jgi:hypothetical protein
MTTRTDPLTLQLLRWIAERPRTYGEALEAWHTTCPRLSIWEDACADGLIDRQTSPSVGLTPKGRARLQGT